MAFRLAEGFVELTARDQKLRRSLDQTNTAMKKTEATAKRLGNTIETALAGSLTVGVAIAAGRKLIAVHNEQERAETKLEAVLKKTGTAIGITADEVKRYASELQKMTMFGDEVTLSAAAILATFRNLNRDAFKQALALSQDIATVMGTDLNQAVLQLGKVLDNPVKNLSALTRSGISFSKEQENMIKNMAETNRLGEAMAIILEAINAQLGGAAQADAKTFAGQLQQVANAIGDIGEEIAKSELIPLLRLLTQQAGGGAGGGANILGRVGQIPDLGFFVRQILQNPQAFPLMLGRFGEFGRRSGPSDGPPAAQPLVPSRAGPGRQRVVSERDRFRRIVMSEGSEALAGLDRERTAKAGARGLTGFMGGLIRGITRGGELLARGTEVLGHKVVAPFQEAKRAVAEFQPGAAHSTQFFRPEQFRGALQRGLDQGQRQRDERLKEIRDAILGTGQSDIAKRIAVELEKEMARFRE